MKTVHITGFYDIWRYCTSFYHGNAYCYELRL